MCGTIKESVLTQWQRKIKMEGKVCPMKNIYAKRPKCKLLGSQILLYITVHFSTNSLFLCKTFLQNVEQHSASSSGITEKEGENAAGTLHARHLGYMAARRVTRKHRL